MRFAMCFGLGAIVASVQVRLATATLYGITGDGANVAETLYTVDPTNAALTLVQGLATETTAKQSPIIN